MERLALSASQLHVTYDGHRASVKALRGVDLSVAEGEFVCIVGPSGCGKSTLLHTLAGLLTPASGSVVVGGVDIHSMSIDDCARWRRRNLGMVHQFFNLIPSLTVAQNVATPLLLDGTSLRQIRHRVEALLEALGIASLGEDLAGELSGGEMQRVAIGRALVAEPSLILADEPTGNLDSEAGQVVLELLQDLASEGEVALVVATHDPVVSANARRVVSMRDGRVEVDSKARTYSGAR